MPARSQLAASQQSSYASVHSYTKQPKRAWRIQPAKRPPKTFVVDNLGLEETNKAVCYCIIVGIAFAPYRWLKVGLSQALAEANVGILTAVGALPTINPKT